MPPAAKRHAKTQLCRRVPKRQASSNGRWIQLSSAEADLLFTIQVDLSTILTFVTAMTQLLLLVLAVEAVANVGDANYDVLDAAVNSLAIAIMGWLGILCAFRVANGLLFVAIEQLRVCHLLTNCYICLNGDHTGSINTFNIRPPR